MILHYDGSGGYVLWVLDIGLPPRVYLMARYSTKLDAERRLAMQEERQALEIKLLDV
jgi:hypothetical protein